MKEIDYSYQKEAAEQVLKNAYDSNFIASILAACPSAGKTTISHMIINDHLEKYPNDKIVVITEGQNTLKNQYLEELKNAHVDINFSYGEFGDDVQVQVGVAQSLHKLEKENIDMMIIDEAHNFYLAPTIQNMEKKLNPKYKILMTGSPSKYNKHNEEYSNKFGIHYISGNKLQKMGVFSGVELNVVHESSLKNILSKAEKKGANLSKVMIACKDIRHANRIKQEAELLGINAFLSTSKNDKSDNQIRKFKKIDSGMLIVVKKGILGFNDKNITTLIDMKSSNNIDASFQLFARVLRVHPKNVKKYYFRIASNDSDLNNQVIMLHKMMALMNSKMFKKFNGSNLKAYIN